jgi:hypothetical protein
MAVGVAAVLEEVKQPLLVHQAFGEREVAFLVLRGQAAFRIDALVSLQNSGAVALSFPVVNIAVLTGNLTRPIERPHIPHTLIPYFFLCDSSAILQFIPP